MRLEIKTAVKELLEDLGIFRNIHIKQTDWRLEGELPVAWVLLSDQEFKRRTINNLDLRSLKPKLFLTIRLYCDNDDEVPGHEIDQLIDQVLLILISNTTLKDTVATCDPIHVQTDGGLLVTKSMADILVEVQV